MTLALIPPEQPGDALGRNEPPAPALVAIPPHIVAAIANAAVEAYKQALIERRRANARARYHSDPEYRARHLAYVKASRERRRALAKLHQL